MKATFPLLGGLALTLLLLVGCSDDNTAQAPTLEQTNLLVNREYTGVQGPFPDRGYFLVQRPEVWEALWNHQDVPDVDFAHETVVVALMGQQPTSGYATRITAVRPDGQGYSALIAESIPTPASVSTPGATYPFSMVVVPKLTQPVNFVLTNAPAPVSPYPIVDGFQGLNCAAAAPETSVMRDALTWSQFWTDHFGATLPIPDVDFAHYMAVAVSLGQKPTGGYGVSIPLVQQAADHLIVNYRVQGPKPGEVVPQHITSPYAIVIIPTTPLPITFHSMGTMVTPGVKD